MRASDERAGARTQEAEARTALPSTGGGAVLLGAASLAAGAALRGREERERDD